MRYYLLSLIFQVLFAMHALRTGRGGRWVTIILVFPVVGMILYALMELLPDLRASRAGRRVERRIGHLLDPYAELREAKEAFEAADTAATRLRYARARLAAGEPGAAAELLRAAVAGFHADDAQVWLDLARAELEAGRPQAAAEAYASFRAHLTDRLEPGAELLGARIVAAGGDRAAARAAFDAVVSHFAGAEAKCRYATWLADIGDHAAARAMYDEVLAGARRAPAHVRELNAEWIDIARRARG